MKKLLAGSCVFVFLVLTCELLLNLPGKAWVGNNCSYILFVPPFNLSSHLKHLELKTQNPFIDKRDYWLFQGLTAKLIYQVAVQ